MRGWGFRRPPRVSPPAHAPPAELFPQYSTLEYTLPPPFTPSPPAFLFLIDVAQPEASLRDACTAAQQAVSLLPDSARVGLLTFGALITLYELGAGEVSRAWSFRGDRDADAYRPERVQAQLGLQPAVGARGARAGGPPGGRPMGAQAAGLAAAGAGRFLPPLADCEFSLSEALQALQPDPPVAEGVRQRQRRCTGAALAVAVALLEGGDGAGGARLLLLTAGPATVGPATVVGVEQEEELRSHKDFEKGSAKRWDGAVGFYGALGERLATAGCALDVFACALDQVGLAELKSAVEPSGGLMVMAEEFRSENFRASLARLLERAPDGTLALAGCGSLEVFVPKEVRCAGAVGAAAPQPSRAAPGAVSEVPMGMGGTTSWRLCSLGSATSLALYFEVVNAHANALPEGAPLYLQFATSFTRSDGQRRLRVSTVARAWAPSASSPAVAHGFDQEAAAVLLARLACYKAEHEEAFDALRWLDRLLIRLCAKFGEFTPNVPASLQLPPQFAYLPQFMFNLRRSPLLQVFNNSPDETAFFRLTLQREPTSPSLLMIQPTLLAYSFEAGGEPLPVALDVSELTPERVLLLDSFFTLCVHTGATLAAWRKAGYADQPEHEALRALLEAPERLARELSGSRCPTSRVVLCDQGRSQARFLLARLNPSATHATPPEAQVGEVIFTEDVSLAVFLSHLQKLAVSS